MKLRYLLIVVLMMMGCTDAEHAITVLKQQGYKNIQMTGYDFFACSKDDFYHTGFRATTRDNDVVNGTVCAGIFFKGSTIRFD